MRYDTLRYNSCVHVFPFLHQTIFFFFFPLTFLFQATVEVLTVVTVIRHFLITWSIFSLTDNYCNLVMQLS